MQRDTDFFSGVLQIALGIVLAGVALFGLSQMYFRYQLQQAVEALQSLSVPAPRVTPPRVYYSPSAPAVNPPVDVPAPVTDSFKLRCIQLGISADQCDRIELRKSP